MANLNRSYQPDPRYVQPNYVQRNKHSQIACGQPTNPNEPRYFEPHFQQQQQQQQQQEPHQQRQTIDQDISFPVRSYSSFDSPYQIHPFQRMATSNQDNSLRFPHSISATTAPGAPIPVLPTPSNGYLDPSPYQLVMGPVIGMNLEPVPVASANIDLSILSSEEHQDPRLLEHRRRQREGERAKAYDPVRQDAIDRALYNPSDEFLESTGRGKGANRKKREHSSESYAYGDDTKEAKLGDTDNRKARGRPRLNTKDENAADRRRTQIRLAQRAYRQRKETTISSLRNRVTELESAIGGMQNTFLQLHESAMSCIAKNGDVNGWGTDFKGLTEKFLSLSKGAMTPKVIDSAGEEGEEEEVMVVSNRDDSVRRRRRSRDDGYGGGGGVGGSGRGMGSNSSGGVPNYGGYQITHDTQSTDSHRSSNNDGGNGNRNRGSTEALNMFFSSRPLWESEEAYSTALTLSPTMNIPPPIGFRQEIPIELGPFSYSFHETTFSRRLHRAVLEAAYYLLTSPKADPRHTARVFAYTFCYLNKEDVKRAIGRMLRVTKDESMDLAAYPEFNQLPRRPLDYNDFDSRYSHRAEDESLKGFDLRAEAHKMMLKLGVNQKFLRPDDVEKMVIELGILTSTSSSGTTVTTECFGSPIISTPGSADSPINSEHCTQFNNSVDEVIKPSISSSISSQSHRQGSFSPEFVHTSGSARLSSFPCTSVSSYNEVSEDQHTKPTAVDEIDREDSINVMEGIRNYIDLDILVKELISRGICLGRYPGFKKSDVMLAIQLASRPVA